MIAGVKLDLAAATEFIFQRRRFLGVRHAFLPHHLRTMGREADVSEAGKRDEPLRTSAWEATEFKSPLFKVFIRGLRTWLFCLPLLILKDWIKLHSALKTSFKYGFTLEEYGSYPWRIWVSPWRIWVYPCRALLLEGRLALNSGLNLTRVSFSCVQKHFLGYFLCYF